MMRAMLHIQENISLKPFNTFGIEIQSRFFVEIETIEELQEVLQDEKWVDIEIFILGGGSNVLFTKDFDGLVIKISIMGKSIVKENENLSAVIVESGAGEDWHEFVAWTIENDLGGLENLSLIPGTVGGAPVQNIGAYGVELKDRFISLDAVDVATGKIKTFMRDELEFGYRDSLFKREAKGKYIIVAVRFALTTAKHLFQTDYGVIKEELERMEEARSIQAISQAIINIRRSKLPDPVEIGNGGSFFKNPVIEAEQYYFLQEQFFDMPAYELNDSAVEETDESEIEATENDLPLPLYKIPAAWLIDQCEWKGYRRGDAGVHANQPLVLVNYGAATGAEILSLSEDIQSNVYESFGIWLEREVNVVC